MHIQDHDSSGEFGDLLDAVGGESLYGSGFEAEQAETDFNSNDHLKPLGVEVRE
jgi:hypothetical protein